LSCIGNESKPLASMLCVILLGGAGGGGGHGARKVPQNTAPRLQRVLRVPRPDPHLGRAVQVDPIKPTLKAPGTKRLKLKCHKLLSSFAFKFNLRRYSLDNRLVSLLDYVFNMLAPGCGSILLVGRGTAAGCTGLFTSQPGSRDFSYLILVHPPSLFDHSIPPRDPVSPITSFLTV
jgi:hypothetical protein